MGNNLVSVLFISMNHAQYVERGARSILEQTWGNIEILFVDNQSVDQTFEIADELFRNSGLPYKGFKREKSYGISANLNFLLKEAKGEFVAVLSGDDWWDKDNLRLKAAMLLADPELGLVHSNGHRYFVKEDRYLIFYDKEQQSGYLFKNLLRGNLFSATSIMFRHAAMKEVGYFDENLLIEDWDMNLRVAEKYKTGYIHTPLTFVLITEKNISSNIAFMEKGYAAYFEKYARYPEMREARRNMKLAQAFQLAYHAPGAKTLFILIRNIQWTPPYLKQIIRCIAGMAGIKMKKGNKPGWQQ